MSNVKFWVNMYSLQRPVFIWESHNGRVETFSSSAIMTLWIRVQILLILHYWFEFLQVRVAWELSFCIFLWIPVRMPFACRVAYEWLSFTPVPQTDWKHFNPLVITLIRVVAFWLSVTSWWSWILPFSTRTQPETVQARTRKASGPMVLRTTMSDFELDILKEYQCPQANTMSTCQVKVASNWSEYINKYFGTLLLCR